MIKCCKVIPFYFGARRMTFNNPQDVLPLAKYVYENEKNVHPGENLEVDTIFVNNSPNCEVANNFFDKINGAPTKTGKIIVISGDNVGISFGAYNKAFEKFKDQYAYWAFTEDDIVVNKNGYFRSAIDQLEQNKKIGFAAFIGVSKGQPFHAHGGCGITTNKVLSQVCEKYGCLPHAKTYGSGTEYGNWDKQIVGGELPFTNSIVKLGYKIKKIKTNEIPYIRWDSDHSKIDVQEWGTKGWVKK